MSVLEEIAEHTRQRVAAKRAAVPLPEMVRAAERIRGDSQRFERALNTPELALICEVKAASPSKGLIAPDFQYQQIARDYEAGGASAISVLTEPDFFLGDDRHLQDIAAGVKLPVLRKDFVTDPYLIYEAKVLGAAAVLLICALLDGQELADDLALADVLGLSALVEVHDEREVDTALTAGARVVGVNNRDLATFTVDFDLSRRLRPLVPREVLFVAESGVRSNADIAALREIGADAALVGETIMRRADKRAAIAELLGVTDGEGQE